MTSNQIKSKQRVANHGEVLTGEREVNAMLDLVKDQADDIEKTFLEPACGDGNFLAKILSRKLSTVEKRYRKNPADFEKYAVIAVTSIYGVDILLDNVDECKDRLFKIFEKKYKSICKKEANNECLQAVKFILNRNILCGDALDLKAADGVPIIFSEWKMVTDGLLQRRDFRLDELLDGHSEQISIFMNDWEFDEEINAFIPKAIKEYPLIHYRRVHYAE